MKLPQIDISQLQDKFKNSKVYEFVMTKVLKKELSGGTVIVPSGPAHAIGCGYGQKKVVMIEVTKDAGQVHLDHFDIVERTAESGSLAEQLKTTLSNGYSDDPIRISLRGQSAIVRFIQFPKMSAEDLKGAITFEAENYIPFKIDEVILDFCILGDATPGTQSTGGDMMDVLLIAVKKDELYPIVGEFQEAERQLQFIDLDILSSLNALEYFFAEDFNDSIALIDIGAEITSVCVLREGKPRFIRDISFGGLDIAKRLRRKLGMSLEDALKIFDMTKAATEEEREVLSEGYNNLCSDIKMTLDYYLGEIAGAVKVERIFLSGGGDVAMMEKELSQMATLEIKKFDIIDKLVVGDGIDKDVLEKNKQLLPVAMGLCLRSV